MKKTFMKRIMFSFITAVMLFVLAGCTNSGKKGEDPTPAVTQAPTATSVPAATRAPESTPTQAPTPVPEIKPTEVPLTTPTPAPTAVPVSDNPIAIPIGKNTYYETGKAEGSDEDRGFYSFDYPILAEGYEELYPELSTCFDSYLESRLSTVEDKLSGITDAYVDSEEDDEFFIDEEMTVTRSDTNLVSLSFTTRTMLGAGLSSIIHTGVCIDPATGSDITLQDIVKDKEGFIDYIANYIYAEVYWADGDFNAGEIPDVASIRQDVAAFYDEGDLSFEVGYTYVTVIINRFDIVGSVWSFFVDIPLCGNDTLFSDRVLYVPASYSLLLDANTSLVADINSDGVMDYIRIYANDYNEWGDIESISYTIDGLPAAEALELSDAAYAMYTSYMHTDGKDFLYITFWYDSDDDYTNVYRIDLRQAGDAEDPEYPYGRIVLTGERIGLPFTQHVCYDPQSMLLTNRPDIIGTDFVTAHYALNADGDIVRTDDYCVFTYFMPITSKTDLVMRKIGPSDAPEGDDIVIPAGTTLYKYRSDLQSYVDFFTDEEHSDIVRLPMYHGEWICYSLDDEPLYQLFDGISFAD